MRRLVMGIKRKTVDALSLDRMSRKYHVLIVNYIFLMLYTTLESVFVNTLLYTVQNNIAIVILYRGITFAAAAATMHVAAYLGQKKSPLVVIRTGAFLYLAMYVALFLGLNHMRVFLYPVAILSGSGGAFYWAGHNMLVSHYTTQSNRDIGISILGIVQGVMTLLVPVVAGFVISLMPGTTGYRVMFGVGMLAVAAQVTVQTKLHPVTQTRHTSQARLALRLVLRKMSVKLMLSYEAIRGLRDGAFAFLLNMVLFEIITDESLVGINTFLSGIASITGSWVYGRFVRPSMRPRVVLAGAALLTLLALPLFGLMSAATVMLYNIASSFATLFLLNACSNSSFDVLGQNETTRKCMGELLAFREGAMALGRICGLGVLMLLPHTQRGYVTSILILTGAQLLCALLLHYAQKMVDRKKGFLHEPGFEPPGHPAATGEEGK